MSVTPRPHGMAGSLVSIRVTFAVSMHLDDADHGPRRDCWRYLTKRQPNSAIALGAETMTSAVIAAWAEIQFKGWATAV